MFLLHTGKRRPQGVSHSSGKNPDCVPDPFGNLCAGPPNLGCTARQGGHATARFFKLEGFLEGSLKEVRQRFLEEFLEGGVL